MRRLTEDLQVQSDRISQLLEHNTTSLNSVTPSRNRNYSILNSQNKQNFFFGKVQPQLVTSPDARKPTKKHIQTKRHETQVGGRMFRDPSVQSDSFPTIINSPSQLSMKKGSQLQLISHKDLLHGQSAYIET